MSFLDALQLPAPLARRSFLTASGLVLSGTAVALLSGNEALAADDKAAYVPGTMMGYAGIPDAQERADLIAWLARQTCAVN